MTAELVFVVFMLAAEKHRATFLAPVGIGVALFMAELAGVYYTGGSLNPARSLGPDVVLHTFDTYHWIYCTSVLLSKLTLSRGWTNTWSISSYWTIPVHESS
jgi:aquaporin related protein